MYIKEYAVKSQSTAYPCTVYLGKILSFLAFILFYHVKLILEMSLGISLTRFVNVYNVY